jgi:hypothetical protein
MEGEERGGVLMAERRKSNSIGYISQSSGEMCSAAACHPIPALNIHPLCKAFLT